jgi:calpain-7
VEPEPFKDSVRINSPHYLVKLVDDDVGPTSYTFVISNYEKRNTIYYTLRAYSTLPFEMKELKEPYNKKFNKTVNIQVTINVQFKFLTIDIQIY